MKFFPATSDNNGVAVIEALRASAHKPASLK